MLAPYNSKSGGLAGLSRKRKFITEEEGRNLDDNYDADVKTRSFPTLS